MAAAASSDPTSPLYPSGMRGSNAIAHGLTPAVSGIIGAIIAFVLAALLIAILAFYGLVSFGKRRNSWPPQANGPHRRSSSIPEIVVRMAKGGKRDSGDSESTRGIKDGAGFEMMPDLPYPDTASVVSVSPSPLFAPSTNN